MKKILFTILVMILIPAFGFADTAVPPSPRVNTYRPVYFSYADFPTTSGNAGAINSTEVKGHSMTDGEISLMEKYIYVDSLKFDLSKPINVQILWTGINGTTTQGVTWVVIYNQVTIETSVVTSAGTALDTVIAEDNENDTPYVVQKTKNSWTGVVIHGVINGPSFIAIAFGVM